MVVLVEKIVAAHRRAQHRDDGLSQKGPIGAEASELDACSDVRGEPLVHAIAKTIKDPRNHVDLHVVRERPAARPGDDDGHTERPARTEVDLCACREAQPEGVTALRKSLNRSERNWE